MRNFGYAFVMAGTANEWTHQLYEGFCEMIPRENIETFVISEAFAIPHVSMMLAKSGGYKAIISSALIEDTDPWQAKQSVQSILDGLTKVSLETDVLMLPLISPTTQVKDIGAGTLTLDDFFAKGRQAGKTALEIIKVRSSIFAIKNVLTRLWPI